MRATSSARVRIVGRDRRDAVLARRSRATRVEPDRLARIVGVRDDQRDVDAVREQHAQAADADVVIGEDDGARHGGTSDRLSARPALPPARSSTARIV